MIPRILIAEDSACVRQMLSNTLRDEGYEVIEAIDGSDAIEKASQSKPNFVITDLNMPNSNGIELIQSLRNNPLFKYTPILILTTESQEARKQEGKQAGASGWIVKPVKPTQLITLIKRMLG